MPPLNRQEKQQKVLSHDIVCVKNNYSGWNSDSLRQLHWVKQMLIETITLGETLTEIITLGKTHWNNYFG